MSTTMQVGKIGMTPKGEWNSSQTYVVLDVVSYQLKTYVAKTNVPANTLPTNTNYWALLVNNLDYISNKNLVNNGYFIGGGSQLNTDAFPINSRGLTTYTEGNYAIDNWRRIGGQINVLYNRVQIVSSASWQGLTQYISTKPRRGNTLTASIYASSSSENKVFCFAVDYLDNGTRVQITDQYFTFTSTASVYSFTFTIPDTYNYTPLRLHLWSRYENQTFDIYAVKLELGNYQTLAHQNGNAWVINEIPNYSEELYKCMSNTVDSTDSKANFEYNIDSFSKWYNKKVLIIGDSWSMGWDGQTYVSSPWPDVVVSLLHLKADFARQGSGGFTREGSAGAQFPHETFIQVLEHFKNNYYDDIIVQSGWNDIHSPAEITVANLRTAIQQFDIKCKEYFPTATIHLIPSYPAYLMPATASGTVGYDRIYKARTLVMASLGYGWHVCAHSLNWLFQHKEYRGYDTPHPNQDGYIYWGKLTAAFLNGWDGHVIDQYKQGSMNSQNNSLIFDLTLNTDVMDSNTDVYFDCYDGWVSFSIRGKVVANTANEFVVLTGLPAPMGQYTYFTSQWFSSTPVTDKVLPRVRLTYYNNELRMRTYGDISNMTIDIYGSYQTRNNAPR